VALSQGIENSYIGKSLLMRRVPKTSYRYLFIYLKLLLLLLLLNFTVQALMVHWQPASGQKLQK